MTEGSGDGSTRVVVVVPALDEAGGIGSVVDGALRADVERVIVVDNGSTDDTAACAADAGAHVVSEPRQGYGFACAAGSEAALQAGADVIVYMDGDGSARADELHRLVAPIVTDEADLVLGSRLLGGAAAGALGPHQRHGNRFGALLMRRLYGIDVTDLGPYRALRAAVYPDLEMSEMTFGWPTEMTVKCARDERSIAEVPVSWDARRTGESKVSGTLKGSVLAATHILAVTVRHARPNGRFTR